MKIAILHSYYSNKEPSGENSVVDAQASLLTRNGLDVRVIATSTDRLMKQPGYVAKAAYRVATGHGSSPLDALRKFEPDIVHVHNLFPNWGSSWLRAWPGPIAATVHNFRPVCAAATLFRDGATCTLCPDGSSVNAVRHACYKGSRAASIPLMISTRGGAAGNPLLARADRVVLLSRRAENLYHRFGIDKSKTEIIPNFVPDVGYSPKQPLGDSWVYIGRLTEEKGLPRLLDHWPSVEKLDIYGDGPLRDEIQSRSTDNIRFLGILSRDMVPDVLSRSRGLIFPSQWPEGLPLVYLEALASGRPVVAKIGNSAADDVIASGVGGVYDDRTSLSAALENVNENGDALSILARSHYENCYGELSWYQSTLRLYNAMIEDSRV